MCICILGTCEYGKSVRHHKRESGGHFESVFIINYLHFTLFSIHIVVGYINTC